MGTDIHLFAEYDVGERPSFWKYRFPWFRTPPAPFSKEEYICSFAEGEFLILRDYDLFCALAGVRGGEPPPLFAPRGLPEPVSLDVLNEFFHYVLDSDEQRLEEDNVTRGEAEQYVSSGISCYRNHKLKPNGLVSNPEWHTPSWLTLAELKAALAHHNFDLSDTSMEFQVAVDLLESLERHCGKNRARFVFWFDN